MRARSLVAAAVLGVAVAGATGGANQPPAGGHAATEIVNVTVLDGRGGVPIPNTTVRVEDGRIASVGPATRETASGATRIDGHGGFLVPGFIDMHAHLLFPRCEAGPNGSSFDRPVSEKMLSALLDFGITSVRSPATPTIEGLRLRDDLNAGRVRGPRAKASAEFLNDPAMTEAQLRQYVREALPYKPDYFKVYSRLSSEAVATVIGEAHKNGIPVVGHLGRVSWLDGARLGIDFVTHAADWSADTLSPDRRAAYAKAIEATSAMRARIDWLELLDLQSPQVRDMVAELAKHRISIDPTLVAFDTKFGGARGHRYRGSAYAAIVPEMRSDWETCMRVNADWTEPDFQRWRAAYPKLQALMRALRDGGVTLTTGTDVTNPWVIPGESLHQEFELFAAAGFTPRQILKMTGENAAMSLRQSDVGVIERGRRGDLVLLRADPYADIRNTRQIEWVMKDGQLVSRGPSSLSIQSSNAYRGTRLRYVANAGTLLTVDGRQFLIDAPIRDGIAPYETSPAQERKRLEGAEPPYDDVDAILITHWHEDHFSPEAVSAHLANSARAVLVSSPEVVERVRAVAPSLPAARLRPVLPGPGQFAELLVAGLKVRALRIRHNPARRLPEQHLGFMIGDESPAIHVGDADPAAGNFIVLRGLPQVDLALLPFWYVLNAANRQFVEQSIHPRRIFAMHLPPGDAADVAETFRTAKVVAMLPPAPGGLVQLPPR